MKLGDLIAGLEILRKYYNSGGDGYHVCAEHDLIGTWATDRPMAPDDVQKMYELGWYQHEGNEIPEYEPSTGWWAFF